MREIIHLITPGDHFSPSTGSAIPTVVHGLSRARAAGTPEPSVLVARGTYPDRYPSARAIEYEQAPAWPLERVAPRRVVDTALALLGMPRPVVRRTFRPAFAGQASWSPSVVFCHNAPQAIPLVDHRRHVPVLYAHNNLLRSYSRAESGRVLRHARFIVCVSRSLADEMKEHLPSSMHARVVVVHNGVDTGVFQRAPRRDDGRLLEVAFVGRMLREKGAGVVIDAFRRLDRHDLRLRIVGSDGFDSSAALTDFERELRRAAEPLGDRVQFTPFVPREQVVRILGESDIVVVPSTWREPFALTALEGMAAGAAVVASDIGGIPETVRGAGILVPPGDAAALAAALGDLAGDPDLLRRTAEACRARAVELDWSRAAGQLEQLVRSVD
ncbi:glycosyltransferase family 4 protein [Agromyces sp. SYSU K20354]|uniref:glycosyltransferase family 4 protein n=1 Tax=Agromyces cavernae TaxID=2898659 RepID=UPI001E5E0E59|nr:glycosyltransferase family 4 protein [Agromyces cavernae]MCD2442776.1 glycosyltransferase family 4 protein [Agromyces cavernae]